MRYAVLVLSAASLAAVTGCSSTPPISPDGAWSFNMDGETPASAPNGDTCQLAGIMETLGDVLGTSIITRITDGTQPATENGLTASVTCSVIGTSTFDVLATASVGTPGAEATKTLTIDIPAITSAATSASPATGSATFANSATSDIPYTGTCNFYFLPGSGEGVAAGKIWAAFTCGYVADAAQESACGVSESYVLFENCATM
jgi:hypothetical protein